MKKKRVISIDISVGSFKQFVTEITALAVERVSAYVCVANVHMAVESFLDRDYAKIVNGADITTPDGMPLVKALKWLYGCDQTRVAGMDLMPDLLREAEKRKISVFFLGSTEKVLESVVFQTQHKFPTLKIAGTFSPPFESDLNYDESDIDLIIKNSGAQLVLVALGCPKQEKWMALHKSKIKGVMVGVGGAFPVYAGLQKRAPLWMQENSLEWLFRLCQEPLRLFRRYFFTNTIFILMLFYHFVSIQILKKDNQKF